MLALTVKQPWAALILHGGKDVENRSWPPPATLPQWWRCGACGDRIIPSAHLIPLKHHIKDPSGVGGRWCEAGYEPDGPFPFRLAIHAGKEPDYSATAHHAMFDHGADVPDPPPLGVLLGFVTVTGCHHADECAEWPAQPGEEHLRHCSSWAEPDAFHWTLADPEPLPEPVPMKGRQKLWRLPEAVPADA